MNLTTVQRLAVTIAILGFVAGSATQLTDILSPFGSNAPLIVKEIVSLSTFVSGGLGVILAFITGQANAIKAVQAMPGVEKITVNAQASQVLAQLAIDPTQPKLDVLPAAASAVAATAKGN